MAKAAECLPWGRWQKSQRVRTRLEYQAVQTGGARVVSRRFVFLLNTQSNPQPHGRIGVTASRKVGSAVVRNRAKRLVREAFRATRELWPSGIDVVVIVRYLEADAVLSDVVHEWRSMAGKVERQIQALRRSRHPREPVNPELQQR